MAVILKTSFSAIFRHFLKLTRRKLTITLFLRKHDLNDIIKVNINNGNSKLVAYYMIDNTRIKKTLYVGKKLFI